jgi:hypothetical protein
LENQLGDGNVLVLFPSLSAVQEAVQLGFDVQTIQVGGLGVRIFSGCRPVTVVYLPGWSERTPECRYLSERRGCRRLFHQG